MKKKQTAKQLDCVYGVHPLIELLKVKKRKVHTLYTTKPEPKGFSLIKPLLAKYTAIQHVSREALFNIAGTTDHQGLVAFVDPFIYAPLTINKKTHPLLLLLEGIQDPRNSGAIIRSAYCTNIDGIILVEKGSPGMTGAVLKASAGLAEHIPIMRTPSAHYAYTLLKKEGYTMYMAVLDGGLNAAEVSFQSPTCLVIGNEEKGIPTESVHHGIRITLPQKNSDISYNASVAAALLLFLLSRQQKRI